MSDSGEMQAAREFYNAFQPKLIADYLQRNSRMERAISEAKAWLPDGARVLDIGCGIGWSSHELAATAGEVLAVDLSDRQVELARALFPRANLRFELCDVTRDDLGSERYDLVTMLDVYEHVPTDSRTGFHAALNGVMEEGAVLFLACPSAHHQAWLRQSNPAGLQPVDEDVDLTTLAEVAADLGGELIDFRYVEVWRPRDYLYAAIQKGAPDRLASRRTDVPRNESVGSRLARVSPLPWGDEVRGVIESVRRNHRPGRRMARGIRSLIFRN